VVTVVKPEPASRERPGRKSAATQNAVSESSLSESAETAASAELPLLSALPAALPVDSPDSPADKTPTGHSELYPAVLPQSGEDTGKKGRWNGENDETVEI
jgi:hypothetical protein